MKKLFKILGVIFTILLVSSLSAFSYSVIKVNVIPNKYLFVGYTVLILCFLILIWMMFKKKNRICKIIAYILSTLMSILLGIAFIYLNNTYHFLDHTQIKKENTLTYSIVVRKDSSYQEIKDLKDKTITYLDDVYKEDIDKVIKKKIVYQPQLITDFGILPDQLRNQKTDALCIEASYLALIQEEVEGFHDQTKVITTFSIKEKKAKQEPLEKNIEKEPFILYISGIDQYGNVTSVRGRSDVNILAVVNPNTHKILLVNTPRDYYVQLAGTTGLKDKLTHAGIYGIEKSVNTLEELYETNIHYYLRVNFNTLIKVIDEMDGIDIYSDTSFQAWTNRKVWINEGWNHLNGEQALAYSRERYTYLTGDHRRGANQQQVITAIIEKITNSRVLISKYNHILNSLNDTFQTNMPMDRITSLIRYQLDQMPKWTIESIAVTGYGSKNYTYSMGTNYNLYVMEPDYDSIAIAKQRIQEVLSN